MRQDTGNEWSGGARQARRLVGVLCGIQFVDVLGATVVITALPRMLADLGATTGQGIAVVTAYSMAFGGFLMVASRVGDRVGHRCIVVASLAIFGIAAALATVAASVWLLVVARAVQGLAAAASVPAALRLLTTLTPAGEPRRRAVAGWSAAGAAAGASGFLLGGALTELASWRAVFVVFVVLAALLILGVLNAVPGDQLTAAPVHIPWLSGLLLTAAATGIIVGSTLLGEHHLRALGAAVVASGVASGVGFVLAERHATGPLVAPAAWRSAPVRWGTFGSLANTATTSGSFTLAMLVLQNELGLTPLRAGGLLLTFSLLVVPGSALAPRLIAAMGWLRALGLGLGIIGFGNLMLAAWPVPAGIPLAASLAGLGIGIGSVAATDIGTQVAEAVKATAAGLLNTAAQLGTALGTALVLLLATTLETRMAWGLTAGMATTAALVATRGSHRCATGPAG